MTTPTPGDLSARLLAESQRRESEWAHIPTNNPRSKFVHDERLRELLREAAAALSALPAAGGAKPRPVAWYVFAGTEHWVTHDEDEAEGNRAGGCEVRPLIFGDTTPQPSAAEGALLTNPHTGTPRDYRDVESDPEGVLIRAPGEPLKAAVGAQGDGVPPLVAEALEYFGRVDDPSVRIYTSAINRFIRRLAAPAAHRDFIEEVNPAGDRTGYFLFAPAAGKGVDGVSLADIHLAAQMLTWGRDEGLTEKQEAEVDAHAQKLFAALTRQPVAGDGMDAGEREELERLRSLVNTPELHDFTRGVVLEGAHQRERWGNDHDAGKEPQDWFWLVGYLAGKALRSHLDGNIDKALHHTITVAAACANWHGAILGTHNMRPGIDGEAALTAPAATPTDGGEGS